MATPEFVLALREKIGNAPLWLSGITAVVTRDDDESGEDALADGNGFAGGVGGGRRAGDGVSGDGGVGVADGNGFDGGAAGGGLLGGGGGGGRMRVLLVRRADNGAWTPVTGIIDPGEEPAVAAAREVLEEADIVAEPVRLAWVHSIPEIVYANGDRSSYLDLTFLFRYVSGEPFPADGENSEAAWFALDALPPMSDEMRARIRHALADTPETRFER